LLTWLPYFLFFVALRVVGGEEFDYAPLLGFAVGLVVSGSGLLAMGLFFSSITRNQIIAAVLTFVAMLTLILAPNFFPEGSTWEEVANYASFMELWRNLLRGDFAPRYLVFHLSAAVFFLYLTVKVLEARKWK
jgi:gliding motility-associated transport system permease protein